MAIRSNTSSNSFSLVDVEFDFDFELPLDLVLEPPDDLEPLELFLEEDGFLLVEDALGLYRF